MKSTRTPTPIQSEGARYVVITRDGLFPQLFTSFTDARAQGRKRQGSYVATLVAVIDSTEVVRNEHGVEFVELWEDGATVTLLGERGGVGIPLDTFARHFTRLRPRRD